MSRFLIFICFLLPFFARAAPVEFHASYREPANIFVIMDCVSGWWSGSFCFDEGAYQKYWQDRFGISKEDRSLFAKYDTVRRKYYKGLGAPKDPIGEFGDGIFGKRASITEDLVAPAFYSAETMTEAFANLKPLVSTEDLAFLKKFYAAYESKYKKLLNESAPFKEKAKTINATLSNPKFATFFERISRYYSVSDKLHYQVLFTWFPPIEKDIATPVDQFLILNKNPIKHIDWDDEDIVFHEVVHTLSKRQPQQQKESISKAFLKLCPITNIFSADENSKILEEPMAVTIGQSLFLEKFFPKRLKWDSKLYNHPWISAFSKSIYPIIKADFDTGKPFSVETGKKLGFVCDEFIKASRILSGSSK